MKNANTVDRPREPAALTSSVFRFAEYRQSQDFIEFPPFSIFLIFLGRRRFSHISRKISAGRFCKAKLSGAILFYSPRSAQARRWRWGFQGEGADDQAPLSSFTSRTARRCTSGHPPPRQGRNRIPRRSPGPQIPLSSKRGSAAPLSSIFPPAACRCGCRCRPRSR